MTLQSMTGFARSQGSLEIGQMSARWTWELRSVNGKGLDVRLRLPPGFEQLEADARRLVAAGFTRGNIQATLQYERQGAQATPVINQAALEAVLAHVRDLSQRLGSPPPAAEAILALRGVIEIAEPSQDDEQLTERNGIIMDGLSSALRDLASVRTSEGTAIAVVLAGQVAQIEALTLAVEADPSRQPEALRERLRQQVALLLESDTRLDPQRLHQEAAILATKADLREEVDRLKAHVQAAGVLLASSNPVGRKLDFLAQEFNRECNTICSKSNASAVTALGLEMKVIIDQFREQVQNLE
ncbi:MAG: YicC/YloC family endoribonuclease [Rhizobiaceae bacterium]